MKEILIYVGKIIRPYRTPLALSIMLIFVIDGSALLTPFLFGKLLDSLKINGGGTSWLSYGILAGVSLFIVTFFEHMRAKIELKRYIFQLDRAFEIDSLKKIMGFSAGQLFQGNSGELQSIIQRGSAGFSNFVNLLLFDIIPSLINIIIIIIGMFFISWEMNILVFGYALGISLFLWKINTKYSEGFIAMQKDWQEVDKFKTEILRNLPLVKFQNQEDKLLEEYNSYYEVKEIKSREQWIRYVNTTFFMEIFYAITISAVLIVGSLFVLKGHYSQGTFVVIYSWAFVVLSKLKYLRRSARSFMRMLPSMKKFLELIETKPSIQENGTLSHIRYGKITFQNLGFKYPESDKYSLYDVNLEIPAGKSIGVVGPSGAGKSTLVKLLMRTSDPDVGGIYIDNAPLSEYHPNYRAQIGYVEQRVRLFDNTIRYNVCFGLENVSDEEIWEVLKRVRLFEKIKNTEHGLDTIIGEQGIRLSGGESQRLVIARTIIRKPKILIFDEATSSLDGENQALLQQAITEASRGVTTIIIAHRVSTIRNCDMILMLKDGTIQEIGSPSEMLKTSQTFKNMVRAESFGELVEN